LSVLEDIVLAFSYNMTGFYNYNVLIAVGAVVLSIGAVLMLIGTSKVIKTIIRAVLPNPDSKVSDIIFQNIRLDKGPKIVVIGGGTGLSNLLRGLKSHTSNLSAIVTVADDGGSSGRLREDFQMIAPGDLRNCLVSLAEARRGNGELIPLPLRRRKMSFLDTALVISLSLRLLKFTMEILKKLLKRLVNCCVSVVV